MLSPAWPLPRAVPQGHPTRHQQQQQRHQRETRRTLPLVMTSTWNCRRLPKSHCRVAHATRHQQQRHQMDAGRTWTAWTRQQRSCWPSSRTSTPRELTTLRASCALSLSWHCTGSCRPAPETFWRPPLQQRAACRRKCDSCKRSRRRTSRRAAVALAGFGCAACPVCCSDLCCAGVAPV